MLWSYLNHMIDSWSGEIIIMGDFNEVRFKEERFGSIFNNHNASVFNSFISSGGLVEVPLGGCEFTWCHQSGSKMSKLDRFLISEGLMGFCPNISAITLDRYLSDHRPILLREACHDYGPIPFRMFHYWFEWDGFDKFIVDTWTNINISDNNAISQFMKKLRYLKEQIKTWVRNKKESASAKKSNLKGLLHDLDRLIDEKKADKEIINKRIHVMNSLQDLEKLEMSEIAQKVKINWSIEGDENSRFFHGMLNKKRNQQAIRGILKEGTWVDDPKAVKNEFLSHFKERFDSPNSSRLMLDMDFPNRVSVEQVMDLERNVSKEEIKRAVWDCGSDKSPGPDGFTFGFYRRYWDTIENDVVDAVSYFFNVGMFPKGGNASFIALIPKMQDARVVKDFRPISLIGSVYKIIAKILANRLVGVLGDLIHEVQSAFIANRQILDGPFILDELIHWCRSKNKQAMIFKVDFEKAYDSVRWDYLDDVLNKFGFGSKWRKWIRNCLVSSKGSILVNGSPTSEFYFRKGLKQGDPLSPFLFLLIMESLHLSFQNVVNADMFKEISASGLRMNLHKSKLMGISVKDEVVSRASSKMGYSTLKTPFTYLGIKVGGSMARIRSWDEIVDKVKSRLSKWKMTTLSIGEGIRRSFFIGADLKENKISWFKWNKVLMSKDKGGLGVSSLFALNRALGLDKRSKAAHTSVWKSITTEVNSLRNKGVDLLKFMNKKKITVASKMNHNDVGLSLRRAPKDGVELEQFNNLNAFLAGTMLSDSNDRLPLFTFLVNVLRNFRINISQLSVIGAAKNGWMSFSKRSDNASHVTRDPAPVAADFNAQDYATLVAHPSPFRKFPKAFLCLVGLSRHYTLDEETYPRFLHKNGEEMDIFAFIHTSDPTKVRVVERERNEDEPWLLDNTIGRTVPLLPVAPDRAKSELEASVEKLFDEGGGASHPPKNQREDHETPSGTPVGGKSRSAIKRLHAGAVLNAEVGVVAIPTLHFVTASVSTTPERESGDHTDSVDELNLRTIGASQRFVFSSDSSHHSGTNVTEAEVDSLVRSSVLIMTTVTTITSTVDPTSVTKEKFVEPSPFSAGSSSVGGTDLTTGVFSDLTGSDFLVGVIRTIINPDTDLQKVYVPQWSVTNGSRLALSRDVARQISLSAEVRMRDEYNVKEKRREAKAAEAIRLRAEASNFETVEKSLRDETNALKERNAILKKERNALDVKVTYLEASVVSKERELTDLNALLEKFQDDRMKVVNDKFDRLHTDFVEMALHLDKKFYPHLLTTISGRRWLLTHGMELAVANCLNSPEYLSALGAAIGKAIKKGMQDGLSAGITHGKEGRVLADVAAYNPSAEFDYISALQQL
ncbi:RNA-directed DNA polymerase, eukaryota [Tanacetum coccineum]|uniref:RNA-directed DNA polymerase, eukaryota n=1 Tax=Tanacetum coccineum TaxID=301880 RepID=A0ABQ4X1P4_9ASTR